MWTLSYILLTEVEPFSLILPQIFKIWQYIPTNFIKFSTYIATLFIISHVSHFSLNKMKMANGVIKLKILETWLEYIA